MKRHEPHVSAKACIVRADQILLVQYQDIGEDGHHYNLPGGRVRENEDLHEACRRKVRFETGALVNPRELMFVYEYIGKNHGFVAGDKHSVSLIFRCDILPDIEPSMKTCLEPDDIQTGVRWLPISELNSVTLFPTVGNRLKQILLGKESINDVYWGDIL